MADMAQLKRKVSVTIDDDLVDALQASDDSLSAQVNAAIRMVVEQRMRATRLRRLLDDLEAADGPVDEDEVRRFLEFLA
jgi:hypothetical protein